MTLIPEGLRAAADYTRRVDVVTSAVGPEYLRSPQKRNLDEYGASMLYGIAKPTIRLCSRLVELEDGGPAVIGLTRVGQDGELFDQLKIRSMKVGSDRVSVPTNTKSAVDPRITRIGRHIRRTSFDELPQLVNVHQGTMSLVGPRPRAVPEAADYASYDPEAAALYLVGRPGITGLQQLHARASTDFKKVSDLTKEYVTTASPALDRDILLKTVSAVIKARNAY